MPTVSETSSNPKAVYAIATAWSGSAILAFLGHTSLFRGSKLALLVGFLLLTFPLTVAVRKALGKLPGGLPHRHLLGWSLLCVATGALLAVVIPIDPPVISPVLRLAVSFATGIAITLALLPVSQWLTTRVVAAAPAEPNRYLWLALAAPPAVIWSLHLMAFWPGVMSHDSLVQWGQVVTGVYDDWHPIFHSLTIWLITRLALTPGLVAAVQLLALSGVVGWSLATFRRLGMSRRAVWTVSILVALWPANGILAITIWKDIPYAIGLLFLTVVLIREIDGRLSLLDRRFGWLVVGLFAGLGSMYHHSGRAVVLASLGLLWLAQRRKVILAAAAVTVGVVVAITFGLFGLIQTTGFGAPGLDGVFIHHLGAHMEAGTPMTDEEAGMLNGQRATVNASWYQCESISPLWSVIDLDIWRDQMDDIRTVWFNLVRRAPSVDVSHVACNSALVWRIRVIPETYHYANHLLIVGDTVRTINANDFGLVLDPVLPSLTLPLGRIIESTDEGTTAWLWWRGPLFMYTLLFAVLIASLRSGRRQWWVVASPAVLLSLVYVVAAPAQDFRYVYPIVISSLVVAPYLLFYVPRNSELDDSPSEDLILRPEGQL